MAVGSFTLARLCHFIFSARHRPMSTHAFCDCRTQTEYFIALFNVRGSPSKIYGSNGVACSARRHLFQSSRLIIVRKTMWIFKFPSKPRKYEAKQKPFTAREKKNIDKRNKKSEKKIRTHNTQRNYFRLCCLYPIFALENSSLIRVNGALKTKAPGHFHYRNGKKGENEQKMNDIPILRSIETFFGWLFHFTLIAISVRRSFCVRAWATFAATRHVSNSTIRRHE